MIEALSHNGREGERLHQQEPRVLSRLVMFGGTLEREVP